MKKFYLLAAVALVAGVSCTKQVPANNNSPDVPISFSPIAQRTGTKANVFGEQNATYTAGAPTFESFKAFAAFTENNTASPSENFFPEAGVECTHQGTAPNDYWEPTSTYYWPKAGFLTFRAVSPNAFDPYKGTVTNTWASGITITGFEASTNMDEQVDVLYSDTEAYKQRSNYNPGTGIPYDDQPGDMATHAGINLVFRHALSAVQFRVVTDINYSEASLTSKHQFTVKKIEVLNANYKGTFNENRAAATTNLYGNAPAGSITFNKDYTTNATPYWTPAADETNYSVYDNASSGQAVHALADVDATTKDFGLYGKMMLPMPQTLGAHTSGDVKVRVTYDYSVTIGSGTAHNYSGLTTELSLAGQHAEYYSGTAEDYPVNQWLINHKYLYTLVFKLDPIIFDPKVEAFVEVSDINVDLPYKN